MAVELVGLGLSVIQLANSIRDAIDEAKGFRERSRRLSLRIDSLLPAVFLLQDDLVAAEVKALQENAPIKIKVFQQALIDLDQCVRGIKKFIDSLKSQTHFVQKVVKRENIRSQFDSYSERLDILQFSIQFGILVELRHVTVTHATDEVKNQRDEFKRESKVSFTNRREIDLNDDKEDEKMLLACSQDIKAEQLETKMLVKQLAEQVRELTHSVSKPAPKQPSGFKLEQVKVIHPSELERNEKIGEGCLGITYKGRYMMDDVAIKLLQPDRRSNLLELQENLKKEAENLKKFDSKHVVRLWGIVTEPGSDPMVVSEYMNKGTLRGVLDEIKKSHEIDFSWQRRIHISLGGALGLYRIHNMQPPMLHCAIGSDKFLLNSNWEIKICDVGFAKTRTSAGITRNSSTQYFAPEHLLNNKQNYDERSENYGYGIVMWEIATCDIPFKDMKIGQQMNFLAIEKKSEPLPEETPPCFAGIINLCRSCIREERPLTGELVEKLQKCVEAADSWTST